MKKTQYTKPATRLVSLEAESAYLLSTSLGTDSGNHSDIDALSRGHGGWNSTEWTDAAED